jgi:ABC-type amino acid transport substrate-binding protein
MAYANSTTAVPDLTAASGTADGTVADVGAAFSQATLNDNFKELATKVNAILAALRASGVLR